MIGDDDVDEMKWLRDRDPLRGAPPSLSPRDDPRAHAILERVLADDAHPTTRRYLIALVAVAVAASAAAAWLVLRQPDDPSQVACYAEASLSSDIAAVSPGTDVRSGCRDAWEQGDLDPERTDAPPLAACLLDTGIIGVFPADEVTDPCRELGLEPAEVMLSDTGRAVVEVNDRLSEQLGATCVDFATARTMARAELDRAGLDEWRVVAPEGDVTGLCAGLVLGGADSTIQLAPAPPPPPAN